jgi:hypothetical protein
MEFLSVLKLRLKLAVMSYKWKIIVPECKTPDQDNEELGDLSGPKYQHICERNRKSLA